MGLYIPVRRCIFRLNDSGGKLSFILSLWDTGSVDSTGKTRLAYRLVMKRPGRRFYHPVFDGSDFCASPLHAIDSDETVKALMGFLCLRPGDTDREYFDSYTSDQLDFAEAHAEALQAEVYNRFGYDD
jgi:hypothetical protein